MSSESMKVLQLRWIESVQKTYDAFDKAGLYSAMDVKHLDVKHKFDEVILVHNEMVTQFCTTIDNIEEELVRTTHTIKYINEATAKLKEQINNG